MKRIAVLLAVVCAAYAQEGNTVSITDVPPRTGVQQLFFYTGSLLSYICMAPSNAPEYTLTLVSATNAATGVFTITAHGWSTATRPIALVAGGTGNWTAVNGQFVITPTAANTFTIAPASTGTAVDTSTFGAVTGTITFKTMAPRTNQAIWSIMKLAYDANSLLTSRTWSKPYNDSPTTMNKVCDSRATLAYQ